MVAGRRFERVGPVFPSSTCYLDPIAPLGPNKRPLQEPPQEWSCFRKRDERGQKSTLSTFTERDIVDDCVAVILPPQLTLLRLFCNFALC